MTVEEIARKVCENTHLKLCEQCEAGAVPGYSLEQYWKKHKEYFIERAKIFLEVKECLEEK
jgi:hypothetical protein